MSPFEIVSIRQEGRAAYFTNFPMDEEEKPLEKQIKNPYEEGTEKHKYWSAGYIDASFDTE